MLAGARSTSSSWPRVGSTSAELVHAEGTARLLRYPARADSRGVPPLLLVSPFINRAYILDLTPATSFVGALQDAGVETFLVDWGRPTLADRNTGIDTLAGRLLPRFEERALAASGAKKLALAGYCIGGTVATIRATLATNLAGLMTMHAPVSFEDAGLLGVYAREGHLPLEALLQAFGNMPGWLLQTGFYGQRPIQHATRFRRIFDRVDDETALEEAAATEIWNSDNIPLTGATYRALIQDLYRDDRLAKGTLEIAGRRAQLANIQCPVLVIDAEDDTICLPHQARALLAHVSSESKRELILRGGHVRSLIAPKARVKVAAAIAQWLGELA